MLKPRLILLCLLSGLAGCSTSSRHSSHDTPDWTDGDADRVPIETVADAPAIVLPRDVDLTSGTNAVSTPSTWVSFARWARENRAGTVMRVSTVTNAFVLQSPAGVLEIQTGSLAAKWNGVGLRLGFEPQRINDQPFVHALDLEKNVQPLLTLDAPAFQSVRTIVLDPGHGGSASGTVSVLDGSEEKHYALDWALRIAPLLTRKGWRVHLTRTNDTDVALTDRVAIADRLGADLFISLHFNSAAPSQEQSGLETYCLTPSGMASTLTRGYADEVTALFPNNGFDPENLRLAMRLHSSLLKTGAYVDRGVRRARFMTVLRGQTRPAVLIEAGFLSNPAEARRIANPAFRQRLAEAVADTLIGLADAPGERPAPLTRVPVAAPVNSNVPATFNGPISPRPSEP